MSSEENSVANMQSRWVDYFAADQVEQNYSRHVSGVLFSLVKPTRVSDPQLLLLSSSVARNLGFSKAFCDSEIFLQAMAGNSLLPGSKPYATRYGGHQFGQWAGQLGDGRAINLGEIPDAGSGIHCLQLKGAGPTPYSRGADGRAVLRSSVREFLGSEAMHFLGIPSTRALSLVETGDEVMRDMFYDGNAKEEAGAIVCRVAPSFTRFGHFQLCAMKGELALLQQLVDFTIAADFPALQARHIAGELNKDALYRAWFAEVSQRTLDMLLGWMRTGFVHGVLNSDNMSILGLTIDYGPYGWLDNFDPNWTPNTTDASMHRYAFGQQPAIVQWNLYQLANALLPVIGNKAALEEELQRFAVQYELKWREMMLAKIGLTPLRGVEDDALLSDLMRMLSAKETDFTVFFRRLAGFDHLRPEIALEDILGDALYHPQESDDSHRQMCNAWAVAYARRLDMESTDLRTRRQQMNRLNPCFVMRNYLTQEAIDRADRQDFSMLHELHEALHSPYEEDCRFARFYLKRPDWARNKAGCSMLSCSS